MKTLKIRITFTEGLLGTAPADKEIYETYIGDKAPDAPTLEEEVAAVGVGDVVEKGMTIFRKTEDGVPFIYDYQVKGFFKGACGMLSRVKTSESAKLKAYKKIIDGLVFVSPRQILLGLPDRRAGIGLCQRPLRAQTAQGERVALAISEEAPAGTEIVAEILCLVDEHKKVVEEWLEYGQLHGLGQWRNSGRGRFGWEKLEDWN